MLKKDSFLEAERGGDVLLTSLPLEGGRGGDAVSWPRPPERLSVLGEVLTVFELWPLKCGREMEKQYKFQSNNLFSLKSERYT